MKISYISVFCDQYDTPGLTTALVGRRDQHANEWILKRTRWAKLILDALAGQLSDDDAAFLASLGRGAQ